MDHAEARELLDLAAAEPSGLDRLMAGDTPSAMALAGHLAGCAACTEEYSRLRRSVAVLRDVIATQPPPELRERTLAFIAAVGRPRGTAAVGVAPVDAAAVGPAADGAPDEHAPADSLQPAPHLRLVESSAGASGGRPVRRRLAWIAAAAALVLASAGVTGAAVSSLNDTSARQASLQLEGLAEVATWTVRLDAEPDVRHVVLTANVPVAGDPQIGTLVFSPRTGQLVMVADGLPNPPSGKEYRCWVEIAGQRQKLGKMYVNGDLAYWTGDSDVLATVPPGATFGVTLADLSGTGANPTVLSGTLQST